jgi:hypothetical protein
MDATNETLRHVGHAIRLDKMLMRIARLALDSMLVNVRTHQQTTQTNDASFGAMNRSVECNWHCNMALHRFFICVSLWYRRRMFKHRLNDKKTFFRLNV